MHKSCCDHFKVWIKFYDILEIGFRYTSTTQVAPSQSFFGQDGPWLVVNGIHACPCLSQIIHRPLGFHKAAWPTTKRCSNLAGLIPGAWGQGVEVVDLTYPSTQNVAFVPRTILSALILWACHQAVSEKWSIHAVVTGRWRAEEGIRSRLQQEDGCKAR